jgi:hypothetical protein
MRLEAAQTHVNQRIPDVMVEIPRHFLFLRCKRPRDSYQNRSDRCGKGKTFQQAIKSRFSAIQTSNHECVQLLGIIRFTEGELPMGSAETLERELHIKLASLQRFKQHTKAAEWFNVSDELLDYIKSMTESPEGLGIPRIIASTISRL